MRNLRAERARAGLTLQELSDRSGVTVATLSPIERGKQTPQVTTLHKVADALGVPVDVFLEEEVERVPLGAAPR